MSKSEIARIREHIALEEQAAWNGLFGPAIVASHKAITARMEQGAQRLLKLIEAGRHEEVRSLMELPSWGAEDNPPVPPPAVR
jgi:hypothetical protein